MKYFIVLAVFVCCAYTAPLKNELIQRATALDTKIKAEIKKLTDEKREHLATLLEEEEKRLETLSKALSEVKDTEEVKRAVLEDELITMEFRVENELNMLQREAATQELLEANAKILEQWVKEEIKLLENTEGPYKERAERVAAALRREEKRLEEIAAQLPKAQNQRVIEMLEVQLRALEVRLYEALRALHFNESTTAHPGTGTTKAHVTGSHATARPTTAKPATHKPSTAQPATHKPSTHASPRPSTVRPTTKAY